VLFRSPMPLVVRVRNLVAFRLSITELKLNSVERTELVCIGTLFSLTDRMHIILLSEPL